MAGKKQVPKALKATTFKKGSTKTKRMAAKGGRKSGSKKS